ncbi:Secreted RxLR effector peptide protein [Phytophthora palmivora]|uniref:Secreted RxLR effector peptide protein n=1 Tax=Phytophthora palmivora TaxID=4796 RepID=A0A2P4XKH9_9STRA|nr:Secreted RxLR effector peptide protein [Phytophthora palmivora]
MALHSIILLAAGFLMCISSIAATTSNPDFTTKVRVFTDNHHSISTERMLRVESKGENDEARGGIDKLTNLITSKASKIRESADLKAAMYGKDNGVRALNKLHLGDDVASALANKKLDTLKMFITKFNEKNPNRQITLIGTLSARYGDDVVANTLQILHKNSLMPPELAATARTLREEQLSEWLMKDKSVMDVFKLLKLSDDGYETLFSRKMEVLVDYIKKFNVKYSEHETLLMTLTTSVGDESKLVPIIAKAKTNSLTEVNARRVENQLVKKWRSENLEPENVWKLLNMGTNADDVISSGKLRTFSKYASKYNKNNPNSEVSVIGIFTAKYGDAAVAKALLNAKDHPSTKEFATMLQMKQLEGWMKREMSVDDAFTLLKIKSDDTLSLVANKFDTLDEYIKLFNSENPLRKANTFTVLRDGFGEANFAIMLSKYSSSQPYASEYQDLLFKDWIKRKLQPMNFFVDIFKVPEEKLAAMSDEAKLVVTHYKNFYNTVSPQGLHDVRPRRS